MRAPLRLSSLVLAASAAALLATAPAFGQGAGGQPTDALPDVGDQTPLGRWGQPAELATAYVYLASDAAKGMTGSMLNLDGGWTAM